MNNSVTLKIDAQTKDKIIDFYQDFKIDSTENYVIFFAKYENVVIKIYANKKGEFKALFSGENALKEAQIFDENAFLNVAKEKINEGWIDELDQIGSDEVGVGDLFGPTVVVACFVSTNDIPYLKSLGVNDSKKLTEEKILTIAPLLMERLPYSSLTMSNQKLNEMLEIGEKKLALEAKMHNRAQLNVLNKINKCVPIYLDQFLNPSTYYKYLGNDTVVPNLYFKTKGESYYPSIACSSIIARYIFLTRMNELNEKYNVQFPLGAGQKVDEFLDDFLKSHSVEETKNLVKAHFVNFKNKVENVDKD